MKDNNNMTLLVTERKQEGMTAKWKQQNRRQNI